MAIIRAYRIPSQLDGAESCGPDQHWDPNYVYNGIKGQCTPKSMPLVQMASGGSGAAGFLSSILGALTPKPAAAPAAPAYAMPAPSSGMSQNTMIAIGLGAVGLIALVMIARK